MGLQTPQRNLTYFKFCEALAKIKCRLFSSLSVVMGVDLYLVTGGQHLCFQAFCSLSIKLLPLYTRLNLTIHILQLCRDCNAMYHCKQSGPRLCAQTHKVVDLSRAEASQRPPQLPYSLLLQ